MHNIKFVADVFQEQEVDDDLEFLVLASDGLWDVVPNEVATFLKFGVAPVDL